MVVNIEVYLLNDDFYSYRNTKMTTSQSCLRYVGVHHAPLTELLLITPLIQPSVDTNGISLHLSSYLHSTCDFLYFTYEDIQKCIQNIVYIFCVFIMNA